VDVWPPIEVSGDSRRIWQSAVEDSTEMMRQLLPQHERQARVVAALRKVSTDSDGSLAQVALAWLRYREIPVIPIVGARGVSQCEDNLASLCLEGRTLVAAFRGRIQQLECRGVSLATIILLQDMAKHRCSAGDSRKQRHGGTKLYVVREAKDVSGGSSLKGENCGGTFRQASSKQRVVQIRLSLSQALDRKAFGGRAVPQAVQLWKDVPHPMRALLAASQFAEGAVIDTVLCAHEAL